MKLALIFSTATLAIFIAAIPSLVYSSSFVPSNIPYPSSRPAGLGLMDDNAVPNNRLPPGGIASTNARRKSAAHRAQLRRQTKNSDTYYNAESEK